MKWEDYVRDSENILDSQQVPSSLDIITLIKRVNPTKLSLSEADRERGYQVKNRLQSLLLEHYGEAFYLIPHPASAHVILIKHRALPSVDACHANLAALSTEAIDRVETAAPLPPGPEAPKRNRQKAPREAVPARFPKEVLKKAQAFVGQYDYVAAEEVLAGMQARSGGDLELLLRGAAILLHEMGAYQPCIDMLLNQQKNVLKDRRVREMLAVAYHRNGSIPEARAILEELRGAEIGIDALFAIADIACKDSDLRAAFEWVTLAEERDGLFPGLVDLRKRIEASMSEQAGPVAQNAEAALQSAAYDEARRLACEALDFYPNCQKARAVISAVDAVRDEAQVVALWARLEKEPEAERRIGLLNMLLERDKEKQDVIRGRIAEEKSRLRRRHLDEQLESLRGLVLQERWPESFEGLMYLMRQPEFGEYSSEAMSLSPFFSVLKDNKRLQSVAGRSAKDLWLRFVRLKKELAAGAADECLETFEELKPWFNSYPDFSEDYLALLQREQENARKKISSLLEQIEMPDCTASEMRMICGSIRRTMGTLPLEERRELVRIMEEQLAEQAPDEGAERLLEEYREALQIGNSEKAAYLRGEITDTAALGAIQAEVAEAFRIELEPVALEICDDLPVDLTRQPALLPWRIGYGRVFMKETDDVYVMIDFTTKRACRIASPVFAKAVFVDALDDGSWIMLENKDDNTFGDRFWRAKLSVDQAAFTASFDMREWFEVEEGYSIKRVLISSERDTDYYVVTKHDERRCPARVQRRRLAPKTTVQSLALGKLTELNMWRWRCYPDDFIVGGEGEMRHVNRNLSTKAGVSVTPKLYMLDGYNGYVYGLEELRLVKRGPNLKFIKSFERALTFGMWEPDRIYGISFQTDTALVILGPEQQFFLNLSNNKYSNKIRTGSVIPFWEEGKWYSFHYSKEEAKLRLRDITNDIRTKLEWREFFFPKAKGNKMAKKMMWFKNEENFLYRPGHWGADGEAAHW